ncbi:MAG: hypothetical protein KDD53_04720, partial [Bdellovibrionales bacterium]|nr:hypothetical protein [Bdellovibrionales bacterium]
STGTVLLPEPSDGGEPNPNGMLFLDGFAYASVYGSVGDEPYFMSVDECPTDTEKFDAGICGCGISDVDSDSDGTVDCNDVCELDPLKILEGVCGCGIADSDTDSDGVADCNDSCTSDANKTLPGVCGCGTADIDVDGNGTIDCLFTDEFRTRVEALQAGVSALKKAGTTKKKKKKAKELKKAAKELLAILEDYFTLNSLGIQSADGVILEELFGKAVKKVRKSFNIKSPKFRKYKRKAQKKLDELAAGIG